VKCDVTAKTMHGIFTEILIRGIVMKVFIKK
jgi:hypothetical protein